jgi:cyanate permease
VSGRLIGKTVNALVVFPLVGHAIYTMVSLVLGFMLPVILEQAKNWSQIVRKSLVVATVLVAARGAFGVCRRLWPTTPIRST